MPIKDSKEQLPKIGAAHSSHFEQEGILSAMPPKQLFSEEEPIKEKEELQVKEKSFEDADNGGIPPYDPENPRQENILSTLQCRYKEATRGEKPKQYKPFEPKNLAPRNFRKVEPFQLQKSEAYQNQLKQNEVSKNSELPSEVQGKMENTMGEDFSNVKFHENSQKATDAGALAYAQGNEVHFAPGQFSPNTQSGQELIGHELAHVKQQREGRVKPTKVLGKGMAINDDATLEKEADDLGKKAAQGETVQHSKSTTSTSSSMAIQKKDDAGEIETLEIINEIYTALRQPAPIDGEALLTYLATKTAEKLTEVPESYKRHYEIDLREDLRKLDEGSYQQALVYFPEEQPLYEKLEDQKGTFSHDENELLRLLQEADQAALETARSNEETRPLIVNVLGGHPRMLLEALTILYPDDKLNIVLIIIEKSNGITDSEDVVIMAILDLSVSERKNIWENYRDRLDFFDGYDDDETAVRANTDYGRIKTICTGNEAEALEASMAIATIGGGTYDTLLTKIMDNTYDAGAREAELRRSLTDENLPTRSRIEAEQELHELGGISENLLTFQTDENEEIIGDSFLGRLRGDIDNDSQEYKDALAHVKPNMTLLQRLKLHQGEWDDNEEAMAQEIIGADKDRLEEARGDDEFMAFIAAQLDGHPTLYYEVLKILRPNDSLANVHSLLLAANNYFYDNEEEVYIAIWDLSPAERKTLWEEHRQDLSYFDGYEQNEADIDPQSDSGRLRIICLGSEAEALNATMEVTTGTRLLEGMGTYDNLLATLGTRVRTAADSEQGLTSRLEELQQYALELKTMDIHPDEKVRLQKEIDDAIIAAEKELTRLGGVNDLLTLDDNNLGKGQFLGMLMRDVGEEEFESYMSQMGVDQFELVKYMIIGSVGWIDDEAKVYRAFESLDSELRLELSEDPEVWEAFSHLNGGLGRMENIRDNNTYEMALVRLEDADRGTTLTILGEMDSEDRKRYGVEHKDEIERQRVIANSTPSRHPSTYQLELEAKNYAIAFLEVVETGRITTDTAISFATEGNGTADEFLEYYIDQMPFEEKRMFRIGYAIQSGIEVPESVMPLDEQVLASKRYLEIRQMLQGDSSNDDFEKRLDALISVPSMEDASTAEGKEMIFQVLYQRVLEKSQGRDGGFWDEFHDTFSNTGETADVAEIGVEAYYDKVMASGEVTDLDIAIMGFLAREFDEKNDAYIEAVDSIAEIASTVAAIGVSMLFIAVTGGMGTGAVLLTLGRTIGAGAAAGIAKLATQSAIGQEHFDLAEEGAESFFTGFVEGAMLPLSGGLSTMFTSLIGLRGGALATRLAAGTQAATNKTLQGRVALSTVEGAVEGALSGALGEVVFTAFDENTWNQNIWSTISDIGASLMRGAFVGAVTDGFISGAVTAGAARLGRGAGNMSPATENAIPNTTGNREMDLHPNSRDQVPSDLQEVANDILGEETPLIVDDSLSGRSVRVHYEVDEASGLVNNISLRVGPDVKAIDIELHAATVRAIKKYSGFQGRIKQLLRRTQEWIGLNGNFAPDSLEFEAMLEVQKLPAIIEDRMTALKNTDLNETVKADLEAEIISLEQQLVAHEQVLDARIGSPGRGYVAADSVTDWDADQLLASVGGDAAALERLVTKAGSESAIRQLLAKTDDIALIERFLDDTTDISKFDDFLRNNSARSIAPGAPGSPEHKALRWQEYLDRGGKWDYDRWSKTYDLNMTRASKAHAAVDAYHRTLGWGEREVTIDEGIGVRRLDIADIDLRHGIEHKTGYQTANQSNLDELRRDAYLVKKRRWQITWVFEGKASAPLLKALDEAGIKIVEGTPDLKEF